MSSGDSRVGMVEGVKCTGRVYSERTQDTPAVRVVEEGEGLGVGHVGAI